MYKVIRRFLFLFDPEQVHYFSMGILKFLVALPGIRQLIIAMYRSKSDPLTVFGLHFPNKVGLAAGFDKNAAYLDELSCLGFGHVEIGTVTPLAQDGNPKPRLFRLPADKALINRMGFNNAGAEAVAANLAKWRNNKANKAKLIIGGNIGKNKNTDNDMAWSDYVKAFDILYPYVDYFVVNVSSPNTPGLRALQDRSSLEKIFAALYASRDQQTIKRPILLKIAPDLGNEEVDDVISLSLSKGIEGLIISNTTISRDNLLPASAKMAELAGNGGLSGKPVFARSTAMLDYIAHKTEGKIPLIASGGIFTGKDAQTKINAGAELLQVWTGFIYEGPSITKNICKSLK
jgi:dihydroorotate dehydrogenase